MKKLILITIVLLTGCGGGKPLTPTEVLMRDAPPQKNLKTPDNFLAPYKRPGSKR